MGSDGNSGLVDWHKEILSQTWRKGAESNQPDFKWSFQAETSPDGLMDRMQSYRVPISGNKDEQVDGRSRVDIEELRGYDVLMPYVSTPPNDGTDMWAKSPKKRYLLSQQNQCHGDQTELARTEYDERVDSDDEVAHLSGKPQQLSACHRPVPSNSCNMNTGSSVTNRWFNQAEPNLISLDNSSGYGPSSRDAQSSFQITSSSCASGSPLTMISVGNVLPSTSKDNIVNVDRVALAATPSKFLATEPSQNFLHLTGFSNSLAFRNNDYIVNMVPSSKDRTVTNQFPLSQQPIQGQLFSLDSYAHSSRSNMDDFNGRLFESGPEAIPSETFLRPSSSTFSVSEQTSSAFSEISVSNAKQDSNTSVSNINNSCVVQDEVGVGFVSNPSDYSFSHGTIDNVSEKCSSTTVLIDNNSVEMEIKLPTTSASDNRPHSQGGAEVPSLNSFCGTRVSDNGSGLALVNSTDCAIQVEQIMLEELVSSSKITNCSKSETTMVEGADSTTSCVAELLIGQEGSGKSSPKNEGSLLKCQVCGDIAAGFHCGAYVCEACKKFFIRTVRKDEIKYACLKKKECTVTKKLRTLCQYCRYQKCLQLGMYRPGDGPNSGADTNIGVIPCRVCSAPSSGFHFGAITCEGCKGFFRRMIKEREVNRYGCSKGGTCEIRQDTRNMCKSCRYHKCIQVGMSSEKSRIGRQPNAIKHATLLEMQSWKAQVQCQSETESSESVESEYQRETTQSTCTRTASNHSFTQTSPGASDGFRICSGSPSEKHSTQSSILTLKRTAVNIHNQPSSFITSNRSGFLEKQSNTSGLKQENSHKYTMGYKQKPLRAPSPLQENKHLFLMLQENSPSDILEEIILAGRELDNIIIRVNQLELRDEDFHDLPQCWFRLMEQFFRHAHCTLRFAKKVPGFRSLQLDDQAALLRTSIYPICILSYATTFDPVTRTFSYFSFTAAEMELIFHYIPECRPLKQHFLMVGDMTTLLSFNTTELDFLRALILLCSDEGDLLEKDKAFKLQENVAEALQEYEEKTHEDGGTRFGVMIARLAEFRLVNLQHQQVIAGVLKAHPNFQVPQLFSELFFFEDQKK